MKMHEFTLIASGPDPSAPQFEDRFFEAGCDDATLSLQKGVIILEFARTAATFEDALTSAIADVGRAGAHVERVEPDHLVSLSEIARRTDLSRAAVSLYAKGDRGKDFPTPVARVTTDSPLWDWVDVAGWLHRQRRLGADEVVRARAVRQANLALELEDLKAGAA